ncbi:MAG TPA: type II and III secretion system protein family protein [Aliidongia sp.]|nr:type II and III secretion system protein family protein [Aliidongia sp.]
MIKPNKFAAGAFLILSLVVGTAARADSDSKAANAEAPRAAPVVSVAQKPLAPPINVPAIIMTTPAQTVRPASLPPATVVTGSAQPRGADSRKAEAADASAIHIEVGKGTLLRLKRPAATVFIANPETADVQVKSPSLVYVTGKAPGETVLYAVDDQEQVLFNGTVRVTQDLGPLRAALKQMVPDEPVSLQPINGTLIVSGNVSSAAHAEDIHSLVQAYADQAKFGPVINHVAVVAPNQVNLRVRIAEVDRNTLKSFGINWNAMLNSSRFAFGLVTANPTGIGAIAATNTITGGFTANGATIDSVIDALAQEGLISLLAEPNLTALSGQTASFLAGGEFPVPVGANIVNGIDTITVEFKKFGVSLEFTPTIIDGTRINMHVQPEVSALSTNGQVLVQGFNIPGLTVRRADTSIELGSGESFAIAGLLQNNTEQDLSKFPGIGDVPILGALFRSDRWQRNETELVIIVTPYLVRPTNAMALATPTDGLVTPNDTDRILYGQSYRPSLAGRASSGPKLNGAGLVGPAGFLFE